MVPSYCLECGGDLPDYRFVEQPSKVRGGYICPQCARKKKIKSKLNKLLVG